MEHPSFGNGDFGSFKDVFNSLLNTGKEKIDNALNQYPQYLINDLVQDLYDQMSNPTSSAAFGGALPGGMDEEKVVHMIDTLKEQMKNPMVSKLLAKQLKKSLASKTNDQIQAMIEDAAKDRPMNDQMMIRMAFFQMGPMLDQIRVSSDDDVAQMIRDAAEQIPSQLVARQLIEMAEQKASQNTQKPTENLPAPDAVADTAHKLGHAASDALDAAAKTPDMGQALNILKQFGENARTIINEGLGKGPKGPGGKRFNI